MQDSPGQRLRLTVLGCTTAAPHQAAPAAGFLVQWEDTNLLLEPDEAISPGNVIKLAERSTLVLRAPVEPK